MSKEDREQIKTLGAGLATAIASGDEARGIGGVVALLVIGLKDLNRLADAQERLANAYVGKAPDER